jgi:hypothetical protein
MRRSTYTEDDRMLGAVELLEVVRVELLEDHRAAVGRQADLERDLLLKEQIPMPDDHMT